MFQQDRVYDAVIYGDSIRAYAAAVTLLENGRSVLLALSEGNPGRELNSQECLKLQRGISRGADALLEELESCGGARDGFCDPGASLVRMLNHLEGADLLCYVRPAGLIHRDGVADALVLSTKDGLYAARGKCLIDASNSLEVVRLEDPGACSTMEDGENGDETCYSFRLATLPEVEQDPIIEQDLRIRQDCWAGEFLVESRNGTRMKLPQTLMGIRSRYPQFADAMLVNASFASLSLSGTYRSKMPELSNLLAPQKGRAYRFETMDLILAERFAEGESLAREAECVIPGVVPRAFSNEEICITQDPVDVECDVLVCGGGTAGALAAISAGRMGVNVMLWEAMEYLGGIGTGGAIHQYYYGLPGGLQDEVDRKSMELTEQFRGRHVVRGFHPVAKMIVLEQMALSAGVKVEYGQMLCDAETSCSEQTFMPAGSDSPEPVKVLERVSSLSQSGMMRCKAKVFIDSTGDADLAVMSGARYTCGREPDGIQHIYSVPSNAYDWFRDKENGERPTLALGIYNLDSGYCNALDPADVSRARAAAIRSFDYQTFVFDRRIYSFSMVLGARASRQIVGDFRLGLGDQIAAAEFPDVIGYAASHYDNHARDYENESSAAMLWSWALDSHCEPIGCELPYRIMLPAGVDRLLVACRSLSLDYDAHLQLRMQRDMQRVGEAAGIAAAVAVLEQSSTRGVTIQRVQKELLKTKSLLGTADHYHCDDWKPAGFYPSRRIVELTEGTYQPVRTAIGISELQEELRNDDPSIRYAAALKLAASERSEDALRQLMECLRLRHDAFPEGRWQVRTAPFWKIAIGVFGTAGFTEARGEVEALLNDPSIQDQQVMILALRTLKRIGDPSTTADAVERMILRRDLPHTQVFSQYVTGLDLADDSTWKLELAAAETLHALGRSRPDLIAKSITDPRGYVRYAALALERRISGIR